VIWHPRGYPQTVLPLIAAQLVRFRGMAL